MWVDFLMVVCLVLALLWVALLAASLVLLVQEIQLRMQPQSIARTMRHKKSLLKMASGGKLQMQKLLASIHLPPWVLKLLRTLLQPFLAILRITRFCVMQVKELVVRLTRR